MSSGDNTRTINIVSVENDTHAWLIEEANRSGMKLGEFAGSLLDKIKIHREYDKLRESEELSVYDLLLKARLRQRDLIRVKKLVSIYQQNQSEEAADILAAACDSLGLNYDEVMGMAENDPFSSIASEWNTSSKFAECADWLTTVMTKRKKVMSAIIFRQGEERGFSESTINRVKRKINTQSETHHIVSAKDGKDWVWILEEKSKIANQIPSELTLVEREIEEEVDDN